jgi:hypothetical protein
VVYIGPRGHREDSVIRDMSKGATEDEAAAGQHDLKGDGLSRQRGRRRRDNEKYWLLLTALLHTKDEA